MNIEIDLTAMAARGLPTRWRRDLIEDSKTEHCVVHPRKEGE